MQKALIILLIALISSCATNSDDYVDPPLSFTKFEGDLYEVIFRYAFENNASSAQQKADFYSLEVDEQDPENKFIKRFDDIGKKIYPSSVTQFSCKKGIFTSEQKGRGLHFEIYNLEFESPTQVKVSWSYSEGCLSSALSDARLEYKNGVWVMLESKVIIISSIAPNKFKKRSLGLANASPF